MERRSDHKRGLCFKLRELGIATRVFLLATPPLAALLGLSGLLLVQQFHHAQDSDRVAQFSTLATALGGVVHELQKERGTSSVVLSSKGTQFRAKMLAQRQSTGSQITTFAPHQRPYFINPESALAGKVRVAEDHLARLNRIRERIDALDIPPQESFGYFTDTITQLLDVVLESGASVQEPAAARAFMALFNLMQAKERAGQERAMGAQGFAAGRFSPQLLEKFRHSKDEQYGYFKIFATYATQGQRESLQAQLADPVDAEVDSLRHVALENGRDGQLGEIDGATWFSAATRRIDLLRQVEVSLAEELEVEAHVKAQHARDWFEAMASGTIALVVAIGGLSVATGRSLARPIRQMTKAMTALAAGNNAVVVPEQGRHNEVGQMAAAVEVFRANAIVRQEREAQIAHMASHDALTKLPNRTMFQDRLEYALAPVCGGELAAVFCIDFDGFKTINDTFGHFVGDQYLRMVAMRMHACLRETDTIARLGGDEFAIIQSGMNHAGDACILADELLIAVGEPLEIEGHRFTPRISIGIAFQTLDGTKAERLVRDADLALYRAKADGGHCYRFFEPEMEARLQARRQLEADLQDAIASESFELFYQPIIDTRTNAIVGCEALVRWMHPVQGKMCPSDFIPIAEETGLIVPLGEWVLDRACKDALTWPELLSVAVNLSPLQFKDPRLVCRVKAALDKTGLHPSRLELEITESVLLHDDDLTKKALHGLRALGVRIALDDFGTGYSSLSYLHSFPFDKIKIDQSFIRGLGIRKDARAVVRAITMLGASLGMTITAEGVETSAQLAMLKAEGCEQSQGYLISPPQPIAKIKPLIERLQGGRLGRECKAENMIDA